MFRLFRSKKEKELNLKDFSKFTEISIKNGKRLNLNSPSSFVHYRKIRDQITAEYSKLDTIEQKIYAAYTAFDSELKDKLKEELHSVEFEDKSEPLQIIYNLFEEQGKHGLSFLLRQDYESEIV